MIFSFVRGRLIANLVLSLLYPTASMKIPFILANLILQSDANKRYKPFTRLSNSINI